MKHHNTQLIIALTILLAMLAGTIIYLYLQIVQPTLIVTVLVAVLVLSIIAAVVIALYGITRT